MNSWQVSEWGSRTWQQDRRERRVKTRRKKAKKNEKDERMYDLPTYSLIQSDEGVVVVDQRRVGT